MKPPEPARFSRGLDRLGVVAPVLCLVHCLATPLLLAAVPLLASERFEGVLAGALVGLATLSAGLALARRHLRPLLPYTLGLSLLVARGSLELAEGDPMELILAALAAAAMISTHLLSLAAPPPRA